ncbi:hypothetical protein NE237_028092 [Protea cynaroides]|uniref:Uncharacterized protein n=1 Tax=Protea cynaroides TaxID=273540 RepID=A0A9Q0JUT8_9MAGN|nr:hypothetical protein NE237_028092 [Protea cynaroides]
MSGERKRLDKQFTVLLSWGKATKHIGWDSTVINPCLSHPSLFLSLTPYARESHLSDIPNPIYSAKQNVDLFGEKESEQEEEGRVKKDEEDSHDSSPCNRKLREHGSV